MLNSAVRIQFVVFQTDERIQVTSRARRARLTVFHILIKCVHNNNDNSSSQQQQEQQSPPHTHKIIRLTHSLIHSLASQSRNVYNCGNTFPKLFIQMSKMKIFHRSYQRWHKMRVCSGACACACALPSQCCHCVHHYALRTHTHTHARYYLNNLWRYHVSTAPHSTHAQDQRQPKTQFTSENSNKYANKPQIFPTQIPQ